LLLYLVRHGETDPGNPAHPLTENGKHNIEIISSFFKRVKVEAEEIWSSPLLRAKQTANILAQQLAIKEIVDKEILNPEQPVAPVIRELNKTDGRIIIVGHLPLLQQIISSLLTETEDKEFIKFEPGTAAFLELGQHGWQLVWLVSPQALA